MKERMGSILTECVVVNPLQRERKSEVQRVRVDNESLLTWIDAVTMKDLGISPEKSGVHFQTMDGLTISRDVGFAVIHAAGRFTTDEVVFALPGDIQILGERTLAGLNLALDPARKCLIPAGPSIAAALA